MPALGPTISAFSRSYFFNLAIVAMAILSSYYWSAFPFDNVCATESTVNATLVGTWEVTANSNKTETSFVVVEASDWTYQYCLQDFFRYNTSEAAFPFIPKFQRQGQEWMTDDQEIVTLVYGWTVVAVVTAICLKFAYGWFNTFMTLFRGSYESRGDDQGISFSDVPSISAYVPQIESAVFSYPLLACHCGGIDEALLDWSDPDRDILFYDLTKDAEVLLRGTDVSSKTVFSQIFHWPPEKKD
jgi:hypothetical protein